METKRDASQDVTLAVLKNDVDYIKKEVTAISTTLGVLERNYVKRSEIDGHLKDADAIHRDLAASIKSLELDAAVFKTQVKTWGAAAVLALGIVQFLVGTFISK